MDGSTDIECTSGAHASIYLEQRCCYAWIVTKGFDESWERVLSDGEDQD